MAVTKQDILNDLQLVRKGLQEVEFYIMNYTNEENISKGVNVLYISISSSSSNNKPNPNIPAIIRNNTAT